MYALLESLKLALASLRAHKLRSFRTLLGVIFGVVTVVAVAPVIEGANKYIAEKIADQGVNTLWLQKFGIISADAINDLFKSLTGIIAPVALGVTSISLVVGGSVMMKSCSSASPSTRKKSAFAVRLARAKRTSSRSSCSKQ